jgi:hypothetical protein
MTLHPIHSEFPSIRGNHFFLFYQCVYRSGMPTRASRLLQQHDRLLADNELVSRVTSALLKGEFFEQAGELYERVGQQGQALDCYRRGEVNRIE